VLAVVTEEFADPDEGTARPTGAAGGPAWLSGRPVAHDRAGGRRPSRLEQAWSDLGGLRPAQPEDLERVLEAAGDTDQARRQVAANLLREAEPAVARDQWHRLVHDSARAVRRAAVDAMVDAGRDELRPLLESALDDDDAWVRWKALRGLAELGPAASRAAIEAKAADPDFRVRLEAAAAMRAPGT
jgi:HEAT repeat protein